MRQKSAMLPRLKRAKMTRQPRAGTATFKAGVAFAALKGEKTLSEIAQDFGVYLDLVLWRKSMLRECAALATARSPATKIQMRTLPPLESARSDYRY
jgi:hypothetical protein